MDLSKALTSGAQLPLSHPPRSTLKSQEVAALYELVEDLETTIAINMQLMLDIVTHPAPEDSSSTVVNFPPKVGEKVLLQVKRLERAVHQTKAQKTLCLMKIARSEEESVAAQRNEERSIVELTRQISAARAVVSERETTIQTLESTMSRLEAEIEEYQKGQALVVDLPGAEFRVSRLTRAVRQDEVLTQQEKAEVYERCKCIETQLASERQIFPLEMRTKNATSALIDDFGLYLTYENYLMADKPSDISAVTVVYSAGIDLFEEAKYEQSHVKTKSALPSSLPAESSKIDSVTGKVEELGLTVRMKTEEMCSLRRLSSYLDSQKVLLMHKIQRLKGKKAGSEREPVPCELEIPDPMPVCSD